MTDGDTKNAEDNAAERFIGFVTRNKWKLISTAMAVAAVGLGARSASLSQSLTRALSENHALRLENARLLSRNGYLAQHNSKALSEALKGGSSWAGKQMVSRRELLKGA